jgi:hypothetical protein
MLATTEKGNFDQGPRLYNFWMLANMCTSEKNGLKQERHRISVVTVLRAKLCFVNDRESRVYLGEEILDKLITNLFLG